MRHSALGWTVDRFGPIIAVPKEQMLLVFDVRDGTQVGSFTPAVNSLRDASALSSDWMQWFGIDFRRGTVVSYDALRGELMWSSKVQHAETCCVNKRGNTLAVMTGSDCLVSLDRMTGKAVCEEHGIESIHILDSDGNSLIRTKAKGLFVRDCDREFGIDKLWNSNPSSSVLGAAMEQETLALSLLQGGTAHLKLNGNDAVAFLGANERAWISELIWSDANRGFVGFGSLDGSRGEAIAIAIDSDGSNPRNILPQLPGNIEYSRGQFCDSGKRAILESGAIWNVVTGEVNDLVLAG